MILFPSGVQGLSDTKWQGGQGQVHRMAGIDYQSKPGIIKVQQKLTKDSGATIDELCKVSVPVSDGSTLWFSSESGKIWREVAGVYTLVHTMQPIEAYDVSHAVFSGNEKTYLDSSGSSGDSPFGAFWKPDGLALFLTGGRYIQKYVLTTAWDISTMVFSGARYDTDTVTGGDILGNFYITSDGLTMFVSAQNYIYKYTFGTAWDQTTLTYSTVSYLHSKGSSSVHFSSDGTKMYVMAEFADETIYEYTLSTAWDITTATLTTSTDMVALLTGTTANSSIGMAWKNDGTKVFVSYLSSGDDQGVYTYDLATAWDMSTVSYSGQWFGTRGASATTYDIGIDIGVNFGLSISDDGLHMYLGHQNTGGTYTKSPTYYEFTLLPADSNVIVLSAEEFTVPDFNDDKVNYIYYTTQTRIARVGVTEIDDFSSNKHIATFVNGDDIYHPIRKQNNRLFIGDKYVIAEVNEFGIVTLETDFNVQAPERITSLGIIDTDLLVGTKETRRAWVKRWDTEALSWYAQDSVEETEIYAFVANDNEVYVIAGDYGKIYFYDGEKMHPDVRIPGEYSKTERVKVNQNAVASFFGIPLFGVSNLEGNGTWQGVYSYGRFSKDYNVTLNFPFPLSCNEFDSIEIGSIIVQGYDLMVSWKSATDVGVDRIDWTAKYESAFIETMVLLGANDRSKFKSIDSILADYYRFPEYDADTKPIEFSVENNYQGFNDIEPQTVIDAKLYQIRAKSTQKELGAVAVMIEFNTVENEGPEIENFHVNFVGEQ